MVRNLDSRLSTESALLRLLLFVRGETKSAKDSTRYQIVVTAIGLFTRQGYGGTSMRAIAAEVGIQAASIYAHFPQGKKQILYEGLREIFEEFLAHLIAPLQPEMTTQEQLGMLVERHVLWQLEEGPKALAWDAAFSGLGVHGVMSEEERADLISLQKLYHDYLSQLVEERMPANADLSQLVQLCLLLCDNAGRLRTQGQDSAEIARYVRSLVVEEILVPGAADN